MYYNHMLYVALQDLASVKFKSQILFMLLDRHMHHILASIYLKQFKVELL